jgi:hypothetical protein
MKRIQWFLLAALFGCDGDGGSAKPSEARMTDDLPVAHAELRGLFELLSKESGKGYGCDHKFTLTRQFLAKRELPVEDMIRWLGENGAGCDCEVMFNVEQQWGERVGFEPKE